MADERVWTIEPELYRDGDEVVQHDAVTVDHAAQQLAELAPILVNLGGAVTVYARRGQVDGDYKTQELVVAWVQHVPQAKKRKDPELLVDEPLPEDPNADEDLERIPDPEPVAAG